MENPNTAMFRHCPACGHKTLSPQGPKAFACSACGFNFFMNCAAAAMALILDGEGRLLVSLRGLDPGKGALDLPGGFAEPGEGIEEALTREIREELNLQVARLTYYGSFSNSYPFRSVTYPVTDMAFICEVAGFEGLTPGDDVAAVRFIRIEELAPDRFAMASARQVIRQFKTECSKASVFVRKS